MLTLVDIAWFAGVLEGEGSFAMMTNNVRGRIERYPTLVIAMCDEDIIARCAKLLGTTYSVLKCRETHHKPAFRCLVRGGRAVGWMQTLFPLLGQRRQNKIIEIIKDWKSRPHLSAPRFKHHKTIGFWRIT